MAQPIGYKLDFEFRDKVSKIEQGRIRDILIYFCENQERSNYLNTCGFESYYLKSEIIEQLTKLINELKQNEQI
jgi:hypothetical protein